MNQQESCQHLQDSCLQARVVFQHCPPSKQVEIMKISSKRFCLSPAEFWEQFDVMFGPGRHVSQFSRARSDLSIQPSLWEVFLSHQHRR